MIDHNLITKTIINIRQSIENKEDVNLSWVVGLNNILPTEALDKLNTFYTENDTNESAWKLEPQGTDEGEHVEMAEDCVGMEGDSAPRRALLWAPDTIVEEIHQSFERLTPYIEKVWGKPLSFHSINLWEDSPGFKMASHIDNDVAGVVIQVYVNECDENVGTEFFNEEGNLLYKRPWIKNAGYMSNNTPESWHGITVQNTTPRRSIYAIYSNKI